MCRELKLSKGNSSFNNMQFRFLLDIIELFILNIGIVVLVGKSKMVVKIAKIAKR